MEYNIVTNFKIVTECKKYKHFKTSLGFSSTVEKDGSRKYRETDKFAYFYNQRYKTTIYGQGLIGDISIYTDHYIKEDVLAIYCDLNEYVFEFDWSICREKGIEWYLGSFLKKISEENIEKVSIKQEEKPLGNPYKLVPGHPQYNPGSVTFDDVKAYKAAKLSGLIQ